MSARDRRRAAVREEWVALVEAQLDLRRRWDQGEVTEEEFRAAFSELVGFQAHLIEQAEVIFPESADKFREARDQLRKTDQSIRRMGGGQP